MGHVARCDLPPSTLLETYRAQGSYVDCFATNVEGEVILASLVEAFYTSWLFKLERSLLQVVGGYVASDLHARQLAAGDVERFSAWRVEARNISELLMTDVTGRTRSWFMVGGHEGAYAERAAPGETRLYFGSAVVPAKANEARTAARMGLAFHALLPFHTLYSRCLLGAAQRRVVARRDA